MDTYVIKPISVLLASFFAMRWIRAKSQYLFGVPCIAALLLIACSVVEELSWVGSGAPYLALGLSVGISVLEKEYRKDGLICLMFGYATLAASIVYLRYIWSALNDWLQVQPPFREIAFAFSVVVLTVFLFAFSRFFPKAGWRETYISKDFLPNESILLIYVLVVIWAGVNVVACILGENSPVLFLTVTADYFLGVLLLCHAVESGRNEECLQETQQNLDELRDFMYTIRAQRHDYNFHIHTIRGLILEEKYQECLEYIDDMTVDTAAVNELLTIKDPAVSAQIYTFKLLAESKGIPMEIELHHPLAGVCVNSYELNKVLGNLLQNAIDASECLRDKSYGIKLITFKKGEFCVISVSNKVINRDMLEQLVPGQSTKGGSNEGVGMTSVKLLISWFKGQMYHTLDEDIVTYTVKLPLILT